MTPEKRARLEAAGHLVVDHPAEWLGLDDVERQIVDLQVKIGREVRRLRDEAGLTQEDVAGRIKSSRPRVSTIERAEPGVALDLMFRAFFALGGKVDDLARTS
jgi:DNA-binding XRE family transcriptional regulator